MSYKMKSSGLPFKELGSSPAKHGANSSGDKPHTKFKTETEHEEYHDIHPTKDLNKAEIKEASKKKNTIKVKPIVKKSTVSAHGQLSDAEIEHQEDLRGVTSNIKIPKVMKDGSKNRTHGAGQAKP